MSKETKGNRKRLRVPISCEGCRRKKVKCNKERPSCSHCAKSNSICVYQEMTFNGSGNQYNSILNFGSYGATDSTLNPFKKLKKQKVPTQTSTFDGNVISERHQISRQSPESGTPGSGLLSGTDDELTVLRRKVKDMEAELLVQSVNLREQSHDSSTSGLLTDVINFYDGYSALQINDSRVFNHGPLSWITLVKKDIYVKCLWTKALTTDRSSLILNSTAKTVDEDVRDADDVRDAEGVIPNELENGSLYRREAAGSLTTYRPDTEVRTIQFILKILPLRRHIWKLVDRFFETVFPFMPYLDYGYFIRETKRIVGERTTSDEKLQHLGITKRLDLALVGVLLLILRFAHLSLMCNTESDAPLVGEEYKELLGITISSEFPAAAQFCLNQFRILRSSNLEILLCSLFMRLYHRYSPEDGDGADADSQIYNGMLFQMAISIGLNRDPKDLLKSTNENLCQLRRKIWFAILQLETYNSLVLGTPSYTNVLSSNTKSPTFDIEGSNSPTTDIERFAIYCIHKFSGRRKILERINELTLNLGGDTKLSDVVSCLDQLERYTVETYKSFPDVLSSNVITATDSLYKVHSIQEYLQLTSTTLCLYSHVFMKFDMERNYKLSLHYFKKITRTSNEIISAFSKIINHLSKYVGVGFDFHLTHSFLVSVHRAIQGQFFIFSRLSHCGLLLKLNGDPNNAMPAIRQVQKAILATFTSYMKELKKLTPKYYYAWKLFKAQNLIYRIVEQNTIFRIEGNKIVPDHDVEPAEEVPQHSVLTYMTGDEIKELYQDSPPTVSVPHYSKLTREKSVFKNDKKFISSPPTLSQILNMTPSNSNSSVNVSPDNNDIHEWMNNSSTEVDQIWINFLSSKKESDLDDSIQFDGEFFNGDFQNLATQQPMNQYYEQQDFNQVGQQPKENFGQYKTANSASTNQYHAGELQKEEPAILPVAPHTDGLQSSIEQQLQFDALNLNGLLNNPLNFNQLFSDADFSIEDFL